MSLGLSADLLDFWYQFEELPKQSTFIIFVSVWISINLCTNLFGKGILKDSADTDKQNICYPRVQMTLK